MREMSGFSYAEIATSLSATEPAVRQTVFEARQALHEFREGRALECSSVRSVLEAGDRCVLRDKRLRAHLRGCPDCEALRTGVATPRSTWSACGHRARCTPSTSAGAGAGDGADQGDHAAVPVEAQAPLAAALDLVNSQLKMVQGLLTGILGGGATTCSAGSPPSANTA